jgi:hypothetical protein
VFNAGLTDENPVTPRTDTAKQIMKRLLLFMFNLLLSFLSKMKCRKISSFEKYCINSNCQHIGSLTTCKKAGKARKAGKATARQAGRL